MKLVDHYCVMGHPVEHSKSPWIHTRFAALTGQPVAYGKRLIPLDGFYEFTDAGPGAKRKDKWLFSFQEPSDSNFSGSGPECPSRELTTPRPAAPDGEARAAPGLFCVAGLWRADVDLGKGTRGEAFTMLTCEPGPDIAPYHSRQIVLMPRDRWADWLGGTVPAADLIAPTPAGTLRATPLARPAR